MTAKLRSRRSLLEPSTFLLLSALLVASVFMHFIALGAAVRVSAIAQLRVLPLNCAEHLSGLGSAEDIERYHVGDHVCDLSRDEIIELLMPRWINVVTLIASIMGALFFAISLVLSIISISVGYLGDASFYAYFKWPIFNLLILLLSVIFHPLLVILLGLAVPPSLVGF